MHPLPFPSSSSFSSSPILPFHRGSPITGSFTRESSRGPRVLLSLRSALIKQNTPYLHKAHARGLSTRRIVNSKIWRTAVIYDGRGRREGRRGPSGGREGAKEKKRGEHRWNEAGDKKRGKEREWERFISRNCIGICMAISILELTYLEMFSLAEIHGRLLRPGPLGPRGPRTYSLAQDWPDSFVRLTR